MPVNVLCSYIVLITLSEDTGESLGPDRGICATENSKGGFEDISWKSRDEEPDSEHRNPFTGTVTKLTWSSKRGLAVISTGGCPVKLNLTTTQQSQ